MNAILVVTDLTKSDRGGHRTSDGVTLSAEAGFPPERLPDWLAAIHSVLPIQAMGEVIRGTLAGNVFPLAAGPFLLLGAWCVASFAITGRVLTRRG